MGDSKKGWMKNWEKSEYGDEDTDWAQSEGYEGDPTPHYKDIGDRNNMSVGGEADSEDAPEGYMKNTPRNRYLVKRGRFMSNEEDGFENPTEYLSDELLIASDKNLKKWRDANQPRIFPWLKKHNKGAYDLGTKTKKLVKRNKMGGNNSAIFSGANTINFTKNGDGTDTVTPMGASAQDIKTAYRKASLNA